jgi:pimeloyl-ACP methyl ester carboxylesterase
MTATPETFEPISRTFVSQGLELHYVDWGNEGAPLLLMVHGVRDHARSWDWTARALRKDWRILALDLRGHGDSQWSPDGAYLSAYHVLDFANFVATLGDATLTIVGHSFGSSVVARYTGLYPDRVRRLALVEGLGPSPQTLAGWARDGAVKRTRDWIDKVRAGTAGTPRRMATMAAAVSRMKAANPHLSDEQARHLAEHGARRHADGYGWKYDPLVSSFPPEDFSPERSAPWREVSCPTLLFYGNESWTNNPETDGRAANFRDHRTLVFEGAGHWLHHDQFDRFIAELRAFL